MLCLQSRLVFDSAFCGFIYIGLQMGMEYFYRMTRISKFPNWPLPENFGLSSEVLALCRCYNVSGFVNWVISSLPWPKIVLNGRVSISENGFIITFTAQLFVKSNYNNQFKLCINCCFWNAFSLFFCYCYLVSSASL